MTFADTSRDLIAAGFAGAGQDKVKTLTNALERQGLVVRIKEGSGPKGRGRIKPPKLSNAGREVIADASETTMASTKLREWREETIDAAREHDRENPDEKWWNEASTGFHTAALELAGSIPHTIENLIYKQRTALDLTDYNVVDRGQVLLKAALVKPETKTALLKPWHALMHPTACSTNRTRSGSQYKQEKALAADAERQIELMADLAWTFKNLDTKVPRGITAIYLTWLLKAPAHRQQDHHLLLPGEVAGTGSEYQTMYDLLQYKEKSDFLDAFGAAIGRANPQLRGS